MAAILDFTRPTVSLLIAQNDIKTTKKQEQARN